MSVRRFRNLTIAAPARLNGSTPQVSAFGSLEFDNGPDQPGEILLDFDPRGQAVEVRQGATVFLAVAMPS